MKNRYKRKLIFVIAILSLSLVCCKSKTEPINNIASWTLDDGWTINGIDIRDDYANFILSYQDREIANVEISKFAEPSWIDRETTADEFVQVYLGQHAELKSSSELQLDRKEEKIQKLVVAWELSAAETENGVALPKDEIWYFGFSKNKVLFCAKLLDENAELEFETIMRTLKLNNDQSSDTHYEEGYTAGYEAGYNDGKQQMTENKKCFAQFSGSFTAAVEQLLPDYCALPGKTIAVVHFFQDTPFLLRFQEDLTGKLVEGTSYVFEFKTFEVEIPADEEYPDILDYMYSIEATDYRVAEDSEIGLESKSPNVEIVWK